MRPTLAGLPAFLGYLSAFPPADRIVEAMARGPLRHVGGNTTKVWRLESDTLVLIGSHGSTGIGRARYARLPVTLDLTVANATREGRLVVQSSDELLEALSSLDKDLIGTFIDRTSTVATVSAPIVHGSRTIGGLSFGISREWDPDGVGPDLVDTLCSALALWMSHPRSQMAPPDAEAREWSLDFTPRQQAILELVGDGHTNGSIATALRVSESTVKADLARAMKALRTDDRREAVVRARKLGLLPTAATAPGRS